MYKYAEFEEGSSLILRLTNFGRIVKNKGVHSTMKKS